MRMELVVSTIDTILSNEGVDEELKKDILIAAEKGARASDDAFVSVTYAESETALFFTTYLDPDMLAYFKTICLNWNNVRRVLEPNAYMKLPRPIEWQGK